MTGVQTCALPICVAIATHNSAREMRTKKDQELDSYLSAQESLARWVGKRRETYAWRVLSEVSTEISKLREFEKELQEWLTVPTNSLYEEAKEIKRKFLRKFRISLSGFLFSLLIGYLINLLLTALGLAWIPLVLNFLGITNPLSLITKIIGVGSIFSWFFAFLFYFRDYMNWRRKLNREIGAARYFNKAVGQLAVERGRLEFLSSEIRSFLEMIGKLIHQPWIIEDKWIDLESNSIETKFLPTCFDEIGRAHV